jgi:hypothetical protein
LHKCLSCEQAFIAIRISIALLFSYLNFLNFGVKPETQQRTGINMVYNYVVTLKNNSRRFVDIFSLWLLVISVVLFVRQYLYEPGSFLNVYPLLPALIVILIAWNIYRKRKYKRPVSYSHALFIAAIGWIAMPFLAWLVVPFVLMGLFERTAKLPLEVGFTDNQVVINTLIRRRYSWYDFNNIVLKDDLLTLDFKNNRLLQRETIDEEGDADEDEFNLYCEQRLRADENVKI